MHRMAVRFIDYYQSAKTIAYMQSPQITANKLPCTILMRLRTACSPVYMFRCLESVGTDGRWPMTALHRPLSASRKRYGTGGIPYTVGIAPAPSTLSFAPAIFPCPYNCDDFFELTGFQLAISEAIHTNLMTSYNPPPPLREGEDGGCICLWVVGCMGG